MFTALLNQMTPEALQPIGMIIRFFRIGILEYIARYLKPGNSRHDNIRPFNRTGACRHRRHPDFRQGRQKRTSCAVPRQVPRGARGELQATASSRRRQRFSMRLSCCGFRDRRASQARTWPSFMSMAAGRWWPVFLRPFPLSGLGTRSPGSSREELSVMARSI